MKPQDLQFFYKFTDRKPIIQDRVFCVPRFYDDHQTFAMPSLSEEIFRNDHPIHIEFCSGNGEWIAQCAEERREVNWIAVERKFTRARKIWSKMKNQELENLFIVCGNAEDFCEHYLTDGAISGIYINFPDPWPKLRHAKHRLIQEPFISMMARICRPQAHCIIVTDDAPYASYSIENMQANSEFEPAYLAPYFVHKPQEYGSSYFNRLWEEMGKTIHYIKYLKKG